MTLAAVDHVLFVLWSIAVKPVRRVWVYIVLLRDASSSEEMAGLEALLNGVPRMTVMMPPICPRLLNLINDFVLLRFRARAPEDLSAIEVILYYYIIIINRVRRVWRMRH